MYKACSRCGKIHDSNYKCNVNRVYQGGEERDLRHTHAWTKKSLEIRDKAQYLCEVCRDQGRYNYTSLEVHHIVKLKDDKELFLNDLNLICLCVEHHKMADSGELSKEYLQNLVRRREDMEIPPGV